VSLEQMELTRFRAHLASVTTERDIRMELPTQDARPMQIEARCYSHTELALTH